MIGKAKPLVRVPKYTCPWCGSVCYVVNPDDRIQLEVQCLECDFSRDATPYELRGLRHVVGKAVRV